jgi:hypothetical protein
MGSQAISANSAAVASHSSEDPESRQMREIRDALGAVATASPAVFWLYQRESGEWHVRREGDPEDSAFPDRESALKALRLAAVRCVAYCMFVQDITGRFERECFNWLPSNAAEDDRAEHRVKGLGRSTI